MAHTAVIMMVLSGLCLLPACFPHIYVLVETEMTWSNAQKYCREKYTDLATVRNEQDLAKLNEVIDSNVAWIGLQPDIDSWRWSLANQDYYGEGEAVFRMWADDQPNGGLGFHKLCVAMYHTGIWTDQRCNEKFPFFCYNTNTSTAVFVNELKFWDDAQSYCRENHTDLASVRNQAENDQMNTMVQSSYTWTGLYRNSWKWSDGSKLSFTKWAPTKPSTLATASCGASYNGKWFNSDCSYPKKVACYLDGERKVVKVELNKSDPSVDLEELQEEILEKFNQRVKDLGLGEEVKLRWVKQPDGKIFHKEEKDEEKDEEKEKKKCIPII